MQTKERQQRHAIQRFRERFGLHVTENDLEQLARRIRFGHARFLRRQTRRVSAYATTVRGVEVEVLYDKDTHTVMTVIVPAEASHVD